MKILQLLNRAYREYLRRKYLQRAVQVMAVIVVFCTTYALILPAITLESATVCGIVEHTHTDSCYEAAEPTECTLPESEGHTHTEECFQVTESMDCTIPESGGHVHTEQCYAAEEPAECTIPESEGHTHTEECYRETSVLTCTLPETEGHTHTDSCIEIRYTEVPSDGSAGNAGSQETQAAVQVIETIHYICGMEETQGHTHGDGCYTLSRELVCGKEETPGHTHSDSCRAAGQKLICGLEESEGHTHGEGCVTLCKRLVCGLEETPGHSHQEDPTEPALRLICGLEEHTHSEACYPVTEPVPVEETLPADTDPTADLETDADWEASLSAVTLTGDWSYDLLAVARSQLGYTESKINYITEEDGTVRGYTRYGQWYGDPYADWSAMFVSFCLHYAEVEGIAPHQDCQEWLDALQDAGIYRSAGEYAPVPGDILFLDRDEDGLADQAGIVEDTADATQDSFSTCRIIAGDCGGQVDRKVLEAGYHGILGYAVLPTEPVKEFHLHSAPDGTMTEVYLGEDTAVPGSARLTVTALEETDDQYAAMANQVMQAIPGAVAQVTLLDISFFDAAGSYLSVSETATVSICYPGSVPDPSQVKVFHFVDGVPVELTDVFCQPISTLSLRNEAPAQTVLTFQTEGFSVFAVVNVLEDASRITLTDPATLDGNAYYIVSNNNQYYMLDEMETTTLGLAKGTYSGKDSLANAPAWTFLMQADGTFLIRSENGKYMVMEDNDTQGYAKVSLTEDMAAATAFTIRAINGQAEIGYDGPNSIAHYLNVFSGSTDFRGWKDNGTQDTGSKVYLHAAEMSDDSQIQTVTNLGGKEFAIVSKDAYNGYYKALAATTTPVNSVNGLSTTDTTLTTIDGAQCVDGSAQLWTFHATDTEGVYTISTQVNGETRYLRLLDNAEVSANPDGRGSLMLGDAAQEITVIANGDGSVSLSATVGGRTGYVNLDAGVYNYWTYNQNVDSSKLLLCRELSTASSFPIIYNDTFTITVECKAGDRKLYFEPTTYEIGSDASASLVFADLAPDIDGYVFSRAIYDNTAIVSIGPLNDNAFRMYGANYSSTNTDYYTRSQDVTITFVYSSTDTHLDYNLNLPDNSWIDVTPRIPDTTQELATGDTLYEPTGINVAGTYKYVANTADGSSEITDYYKALNTAKGDALTAENYMAPGSEYRFLGWQAAATDGTTVTLAPNSAVTANGDGTVSVDSGGTTYVLDSGATLTGRWEKVNDLVQLFVNFNSTLLSTQESVTVGTSADLYTENIAFGRVYNASDLGTTTASKANHAVLARRFVDAYDPSNPECQIVLDAVYIHGATANSGQYIAVNGADADAVNEYVMRYVQTNPDTRRQISVDGILIDRSTITAENYGLYWYSMKYVTNGGNDAYHLDGILIANTEPLYIRKTFSGLTNSQTHSILGMGSAPSASPMQFKVQVYDANNALQDYRTLKAYHDEEGVFKYLGQEGSSNIYTWQLNAIQGQNYAFTEENYNLDGYDCISLISVHFLDPAKPLKYKYYVDSTTDAADHFGELDGADVAQVIFANFYTKKNTGMFSISKVDSVNTSQRLPGAKFFLQNGDGDYYTFDPTTGEVTWTDKTEGPVLYTTNSYGSVHFCNLPAGTYTLEEAEAPSGYVKSGKPWTVTVTNESGHVQVTIDGTRVYDNQDTSGTIEPVYQIENQQVNNTLNLTTIFSLTEEEVEAIKNSYQITISGTDSGPIVLKLTDATAVKNMDGSYSWLLNNMVGDYTVTQTGLTHGNYQDVVSNVTLNGQTVQAESGQYPVTLLEGAADHMVLTNTYINNFTLRVKKVDPGHAALDGAVFDIYTPNQPESPGGDRISYTDSGGNTCYAWKLATLDPTNSEGLAIGTGLRLGVNYVLKEVTAPDGYVLLDDPIVLDDWEADYSGGVYETTVVNTNKISVTANIVWDVPDGVTPPDSVSLTLYKVSGSTTEAVETVTAGNARSAGLSYTWEGLSKDDTYYVVQEELPGYLTTYSTALKQLTVGTSQVYAAPATEGTAQNRTVTVTNTTGYELPETGGPGTGWHISLGLMLMLAGLCLYPLGTIHKKKQGGLK